MKNNLKNEKGLTWSLYQVWNESLEAGRPERELKARDHIWATEIGSSYLDRYLKMKGEKPSNPPNVRSLRKFEAGNLMEWVVGLVLKRAGIFVSQQDWVKFQYSPNLLSVTGKLDYRAGGKVDWDKARSEVDELGLPEFFGRATRKIVDNLSKKFPDGLEEIFLGIKSCSSFKFDDYEANGIDPRHAAQEFHYLKATGKKEAHNIYICKDDLRMLEFGVFNPSETETYYKNDITLMTHYLNSNEQPPKEEEVYFDEVTMKFTKNWKVEYSNYLTMLYGYSEPEAYRARWDGKITQFKRTFNRIVDGKKETPLDKTITEELKATFPNLDAYIAMAKAKPKVIEEDQPKLI